MKTNIGSIDRIDRIVRIIASVRRGLLAYQGDMT